jgi:sugar phosphate isomerase/epimerase
MDPSFGISTHLFHDQRLARAHLDAIAAHGFAGIELFATRTHVDYHDPAAVDELAGWLEATGLRLFSVHAPIVEVCAGGVWGPALSLAAADAAARARAIDETRAALALARTIPYRHLVVHLGRPDAPHPPAGDNSRDAVRRSLETLYEAATAAGVTLALELIPNALSTPEALVRLLDDLELRHAGVCLDFGHAFLGGDLVDAVETVSGALVTTHVHDNRGTGDDHLVPFEGRIDWDQALFACQKVGYDGVWLFELANTSTPADVLARARRACDRFRDILAS